jgi:putative phosphoesterase
MRIGVFSDVHCHLDAVDAALAELDGEVDEVWCAGDIVFEYRFSTEIVRRLRDAGVTAIRGNHDHVLLGPHGAAARQRPGVEADALAWLEALPHRHEVEVDGTRVLMVHGSPWEPFGDYLGPGNAAWGRADELGVDILLCGHTHLPMAERFGATLVVNPGSLGEPRQQGDRRSTYAVVDTTARTAEIRALGDR